MYKERGRWDVQALGQNGPHPGDLVELARYIVGEMHEEEGDPTCISIPWTVASSPSGTWFKKRTGTAKDESVTVKSQ